MNEKNPESLDAYGESIDKKNNRGKRGALSTGEMKFIEKHISYKTIDEISKEIGKSKLTIRKHVYSKNLVTKEDIEKNTNAQEEAKARDILRHREYWYEVKQQFTPEELKVFEQTWTKLWVQFVGDVLHSEELQMKKYITLEIMKDRFGKQIFNCIQEIEILENKLIAERQKTKPDRDEIRYLNMMIEKYQTNHIALAKNQRETMGEQKGVESQLRVSRDDRVKAVADATKNWTSIIRLLTENSQIRHEVGTHIELMRISKDKSQMLLSDFHKYCDNSIDRPLLSKDTVGD